MKIFISHDSRNKPLIHMFIRRLPSFLNTWLDEDDLLWSKDIPISLKKIIKTDVDYLILFLDSGTLDSTWVMTEIEWAVERENELKRPFILPILLDSTKSIPPELSKRKYLQLSDYNEPSIERLANEATIQLFHLIVQNQSNIHLSLSQQKTTNTIPAIGAIINSLSNIERDLEHSTLFSFALNQVLEGWQFSSDQYSDGTIQLSDPWATDRMVRLMYQKAVSDVFSTSANQYLHQWETKHGAALLEAHKTGKARVTRVFLFNTRDEIDERAKRIMELHDSQDVNVRVYINDETAYSFPPELQKDFTVIDGGQAIGVTTAFLSLKGNEQTQATWYFSNKKRFPQYKAIIEGLTHVDVPIFKDFFG